MKKKGFEFGATQLIILIIALFLMFVLIKIIVDMKVQGLNLADSLKNIFIFGTP